MTLHDQAEMCSPFFGDILAIFAESIRPECRIIGEGRTVAGCDEHWKLRTFHFGFLAYLLVT
jgi:hypothetical protein